MTDRTVLVTGATGTVGSRVIERLRGTDVRIRAATRDPPTTEDSPATADGSPTTVDGEDVEWVEFDFERPETWGRVFEGVDATFLVRPPAIGRVHESITPAVDAAARVGVEQVVLLSVLGAEKNPLLPHRRIEKHLEGADVSPTFLRASFFLENLIEVHREEIRDGRIVVPAGDGTTSFVAAEDVAAVAAAALTERGHENRSYDVTGPEALTYHEVAAVLSEALEYDVEYADPSLVEFVRHSREMGRPWAFSILMACLYTTARLGFAGRVSDDVERVTGRPPVSVREWAEDNAEAFARSDGGGRSAAPYDGGSPTGCDAGGRAK